jgi:hypothetical protein
MLAALPLALHVPAAHAASPGAPPAPADDGDASRWLDWVDDSGADSNSGAGSKDTAALQAEAIPSDSSLTHVFGGSQLSVRAAAGSSSTVDQTLAATLALYSRVDVGAWYSFNHPGAGLLARRFGAGLGIHPGARSRLSIDYEHALPENQFGANLYWLGWMANVAPGKLATRLGASLGRLSFTDNSGEALITQTGLKLSVIQDLTDKAQFGVLYTYYSDPHGPTEADDRVRLVQTVLSDRALNINIEKPKTFEGEVFGHYAFDESNDLMVAFTVVRYFSGPDATPEGPILTPGVTYTRLLGKHLSLDGSFSLLLQTGQPANPSFGIQTALTL